MASPGGSDTKARAARGRVPVVVARVEVVRGADTAERADRAPEIHVIAGDEQAAAAAPEARDRRAVGFVQTVAGIHREQPELVVAGLVEGGEHRIGRSDRPPVARGHARERPALRALQRLEMAPQQREPPDVPIVQGRGDRRLQQDLDGLAHAPLRVA